VRTYGEPSVIKKPPRAALEAVRTVGQSRVFMHFVVR
jgi:hypothetical protein